MDIVIRHRVKTKGKMMVCDPMEQDDKDDMFFSQDTLSKAFPERKENFHTIKNF